MRTTIILDDHLGERLKQEARKRKQSLSAFLADAGRSALGQKKVEPSDDSFEVVTFGNEGLYDGIQIDKTGDLLAAEDMERYPS